MVSWACLTSQALTAWAPVDEDHHHSQEFLDQLEENFSQKNEHLYVHLIPHSHDDVGWLKTFDEYFDGAQQGIQTANVGSIISGYMEELMRDKTKRFTQVEMKFFSMWWDE